MNHPRGYTQRGRCYRCGKYATLEPIGEGKLYCDACYKEYDWLLIKDVYGVDNNVGPSDELMQDAENRL